MMSCFFTAKLIILRFMHDDVDYSGSAGRYGLAVDAHKLDICETKDVGGYLISTEDVL